MRMPSFTIANVHDIVYLDVDSAESVKQLADIDVIRCPIYIQQILETIWGDILKDQNQRMSQRAPECPWLKWAREAQPNYEELWNYGMDIMDEHFHRFGSRNMHPYQHGSAKGFERLGNVPNQIKGVVSTQMPFSVEDAKAYYLTRYDMTFTNREVPTWLKQSS